MSKTYNVAVVGATGLVGETVLSILAERNFPTAKVYALASDDSVGKEIDFGRQTVDVDALADFDFSQVQIAFFAVSAELAALYVPIATAAGCIVIDHSDCFADDFDAPLVIPEINPESIADYIHSSVLVSPNSATICLLMALNSLHKAAMIERISVTICQAVSSGGRAAVNELAAQTASLLSGKPVESTIFPKQMAFNLIPQVSEVVENGYSKEEMRIVRETHRLMGNPELLVSATVVRVPVFFGLSAAVHIETREPLSLDQIKAQLSALSGVSLITESELEALPTPVVEAANSDPIYVARVRKDLASNNGVNVWLVMDNVRKGAALNSVQIAEHLIRDYLN